MKTKLTEKVGWVCGYFLGTGTFTLSFLRQARMFHPRGKLFSGEVVWHEESLTHPYAIIRFSKALWKNAQVFDVLGITLRFSKHEISSPVARPEDQDLLFASLQYPWQLFFAPFMTDYRDFMKNTYYTVSPFYYKGVSVRLKLEPRFEKDGRIGLVMSMKEEGKRNWSHFLNVVVKEESDIDEEALRFYPFHSGMGLHPKGFVQHLRIGAYRLSQLGRPRATKKGVDQIQGTRNVSPFSPRFQHPWV